MKKKLVFMMMLCIIAFASIASAKDAASGKNKKLTAEEKAALKDAGLNEAEYLKYIAAQADAEAKMKAEAEAKRKAALKFLGIPETDLKPVSATASAVPASPTAKGLGEVDFGKVSQTAETKTGYWRWDYRTRKNVWLTSTAKAKSSSSVMNDIDLFGIFMPDSMTWTARRDWLQVSYGMRFPQGVATSGQQNGWQSSVSDQGMPGYELTLGAKYKMVGVDYNPLPYSRTIGYKFNGSGFGKIVEETLSKLVGKIYWYDGPTLSSSVGYGCQYTVISGAIKMGGFPFRTTGDGWSSFVQLEGSYHFNRVWSGTFGCEIGGPNYVTEIPFATDLGTGFPYKGTLKLTANVVELLAIPFGK